MRGLQGKVAIVTGGAGGIGSATARRLAEEGVHVVVVDVDAERARAVADSLPTKSTWAQADVSREDDVAAYMDAAIQAFGRVDLHHLNAGIPGSFATIPELTVEEFDRVMAINVRGVFLGCKHSVRLMKPRGEGVIINMASVAGIVGVKNRAGYCASKGAVVALTRAMAVDHAQDGIRVNCICPGTVASPWIGRILSTHPDPEEGRRTMAARQPIGRMGTPEEIAHAALYLAQAEAAFVHGSALVIDGGLSAG